MHPHTTTPNPQPITYETSRISDSYLSGVVPEESSTGSLDLTGRTSNTEGVIKLIFALLPGEDRFWGRKGHVATMLLGDFLTLLPDKVGYLSLQRGGAGFYSVIGGDGIGKSDRRDLCVWVHLGSIKIQGTVCEVS